MAQTYLAAKTALGDLHVFIHVIEFGDAIAEVGLITPPRWLPIELRIVWDNDGVKLSQNGQQSKLFPWLSPPQVRQV